MSKGNRKRKAAISTTGKIQLITAILSLATAIIGLTISIIALLRGFNPPQYSKTHVGSQHHVFNL